LEKARPFAMRMEASSWRGINIINDAYNANPASMKAALQTLAEARERGEAVAVLGDMFELGKRTGQEHVALGKEIARAGIDRVYLLGTQASLVRKGALGSGMQAERVVIGESHAAIAQELGRRLKSGDSVLFKGSRGMAMEKILDHLQRRGLGA
jgi:UDP-N-acetylmuramyl pentapeptide synthase